MPGKVNPVIPEVVSQVASGAVQWGVYWPCTVVVVVAVVVVVVTVAVVVVVVTKSTAQFVEVADTRPGLVTK